MKRIIYFCMLIFSIFALTSCTRTTTHPIVKNRNALMATEVRINIYVADDITQSRIDNFALVAGNNYIKVPIGTHILYWNKQGVNHTKEISVESSENKFILF